MASISFPPLLLVAIALMVSALIALVVGMLRWDHRLGKIAAIASAATLLLLVAVVIFVLLTVWSGSMG